MHNLTFYQDCYRQTGWIPMMPLTRGISLGDFGQIQQGRLNLLGNIADLALVQAIDSTDRLLLAEDWRLSNGVENRDASLHSQNHQHSDGSESVSLWRKQLLRFAQSGSFICHAQAPGGQFISNWSRFKADITLKLTQTQFAFRQLYVITAVATAKQWGLAIAGGEGATLELSAQSSECDHFALLGHHSGLLQQSTLLSHYAKGAADGDTPGYWFKAKKLVLSDSARDQIFGQLTANDTADQTRLAAWLGSNQPIDHLPGNEVGINNATMLFDWADMTLDDIGLLQ